MMAVEMASVMAIKLVRRSSAHHTQVSPPSQVWEGSPGGAKGAKGEGAWEGEAHRGGGRRQLSLRT